MRHADSRSRSARAIMALAGGITGLLLGVALTLAVLTSRAIWQNHYLESAGELLSPTGAPMLLGLVVGGALGWSGARALTAFVTGCLAGGAAGIVAGILVATVTSDAAADRWAGGLIGAACGGLIGAVVTVAWSRRRRTRGAVVMLIALLAGCARETPRLPEVPPAPPLADDVEAMVYLVGDLGKARYRRYPILPAMTVDVEQWAERIGRDSAVVVIMLGDIVYPDGMHPPASEGFAQDSVRVSDQIDIIRGPASRRLDARLYFVAGNHDWGLKEEREGARRLRNLGEFLDSARARGDAVDLLPEAGTGMPHVVEAGPMRIALLDTAWWLFDAEPHRKRAMLDALAAALEDAGSRPMMIAAHHPLSSAGPHGALAPVWRDLGIRYLLSRSGVILQDLESRPYRDLLRGLDEVFARGSRPLLFAGGHEHSLQVVAHESTAAPHFSLVSGSGSKVTEVGWTEGMLFRRSAPGYMQLAVRRSGAVDLYVLAAPAEYVACPEDETATLTWERCMQQGVGAFDIVFSMRLREGTL